VLVTSVALACLARSVPGPPRAVPARVEVPTQFIRNDRGLPSLAHR
jgi:hypothetical protein